MARKKNPIDDLVSRTSEFVEKQKGRWDHAAWEKLVKDVASHGVEMSDDARRHLGNMLEAVKHFYNALSTEPKAKKKGGAKKKVSPQKKAGAKKTSKKKPAKKKSSKKKAAKKKRSSEK